MTRSASDKAARLRARAGLKPQAKRNGPASPKLPPLGITEIVDDADVGDSVVVTASYVSTPKPADPIEKVRTNGKAKK